MERLQSRDAVHHHSIAMKNSLPELRAERRVDPRRTRFTLESVTANRKRD
jgi:hypothetical protein